MVQTFVGFAGAFVDAAPDNLTILVPGGTADGDLMVAILRADNSSNLQEAGWSVPQAFPFTDANLNVVTAQVKLAAGEPASYNFNWAIGVNEPMGYICTYRGLPLGYVFDALEDETAAAGTGVPFPLTRTARANGVGGASLLLHQPWFAKKQFGAGSPVIVADGALNVRGTVNAFQRSMIATDEISNFGANFPARTSTDDGIGGSGNNWFQGMLMRPTAPQASAKPPGFGFGGIVGP